MVWIPEVRELQGKYKPATDRVLSWLKSATGHTKHANVNYWPILASKAAQQGRQMPDIIINDLQIAINNRTEAANHFRRSDPGGEELQTHEHFISKLQEVRLLLCPSLPTTPLLTPLTPPLTPEVLPAGYHPPQPLYPQWQPEPFVPIHASQQDWRCQQRQQQQQQFVWPLPSPPRLSLGAPAMAKADLISSAFSWRGPQF